MGRAGTIPRLNGRTFDGMSETPLSDLPPTDELADDSDQDAPAGGAGEDVAADDDAVVTVPVEADTVARSVTL